MADVRNESHPRDGNADSGVPKTLLRVPERQKLTTMTADVLFRGMPLWLGAKGVETV